MAEAKRRRNEAGIQRLADNIRKHRLLRGMTIEELAFQLNADYSQVSRMERGKVNFSVSLIFDIAEALGVEPAELFASTA